MEEKEYKKKCLESDKKAIFNKCGKVGHCKSKYKSKCKHKSKRKKKMEKLDTSRESNYIDEIYESENEYSLSSEEGISTNILEQKTHTPRLYSIYSRTLVQSQTQFNAIRLLNSNSCTLSHTPRLYSLWSVLCMPLVRHIY